MRLVDLMEVYSRQTVAVNRYLHDPIEDLDQYWNREGWVLDWLDMLKKNNLLGQYNEWIANYFPNHPRNSPDIFRALPTAKFEIGEDTPHVEGTSGRTFYQSFMTFIMKELRKDGQQTMMAGDSPTWMSLTPKHRLPLPPNTWLIHFSDDARAIAKQGFRFGMPDKERLGLTTWFPKNQKPGGYNFAFEMEKGDFGDFSLTYGDAAVAFQNAGSLAYHRGDREEQVIFWGADVDPRSMILIENIGDRLRNDRAVWAVMPHPLRSDSTKPVKRMSNVFDLSKWIIANHHQYRRIILAR